MAIRSGADMGFFLVGGYSILAQLTALREEISAITEEKTVLGTAWQTHDFVNVRRMELSHEGFYDDAALGVHAALAANIGTAPVVCYNTQGNTTGNEFRGAQGAMQFNYQRVYTRNEITKANARYGGVGRVEDGRILHALTGRTASGNTTAGANDGTASSTNGAAGYLQVTALTLGAVAGLGVDILDSADNLTFTSYIGFTAVTAAPAAERKSSTVAIQRYRAVRWQGSSGAGFPTSGTFMVGLATLGQ